MKLWLAAVDRTAVLFLGLTAGALIGLSFRDEASAPAPLAPLPGAPAAGPAATPAAVPGTPALTPTPTPATPPAAVAPEVVAVLNPGVANDAQVLRTVQGDRPIRIGVFGDSFGDGVWSGLNRLLPRKGGYEVIKYSRQATGFTRYKSLNLEKHAAEQLGTAPIDVAVISYGANDTQGVYTGGGHAAALLTPAWQAEIGARVERYVGVMRAHGAQVYWVGLPRMRKGSFDSDIQRMNAFYAAKMAQLGVPFIDTRPFSSDAGGNYAAYLPDPGDGHPVLMRAGDGIHMSMNGYVWITRSLAGRIRAYVDAARRTGGGSAPVSEPAIVAPPRVEPASRPKPAPERAAVAPRVKPVEAAPLPKPTPERVEPVAPKPKPAEDEAARPRRDPAPKLELSPADLGEAATPRRRGGDDR